MKRYFFPLIVLALISCGGQNQKADNLCDSVVTDSLVTEENATSESLIPLPCDTMLNTNCYGKFEVVNEFFHNTEEMPADMLEKLIAKAKYISGKIGYSDKMRSKWEEEINEGFGGSTRDMVDANENLNALRYFCSLLVYDEIFASKKGMEIKNSLMEEAKCWEDFRVPFRDFMMNVAELDNYGGSLALITSTGYASDIREQRLNDLKNILCIINGKEIENPSKLNNTKEERSNLIKSCKLHIKNHKEGFDDMPEDAKNDYKNIVEQCHELSMRIEDKSEDWVKIRRTLDQKLDSKLNPATSILLNYLSKMGFWEEEE